MRFVESDASRFVSEQQATARLIDEVQSEEGDLSSVFYSLAGGQDADRTILLKRLDSLEAALRQTIQAGAASSNSRHWTHVQRAAVLFGEGRATIRSAARLQRLLSDTPKPVAAIADLASSSAAPNGVVQAERERLLPHSLLSHPAASLCWSPSSSRLHGLFRESNVPAPSLAGGNY
jgi:hypothetical protein